MAHSTKAAAELAKRRIQDNAKFIQVKDAFFSAIDGESVQEAKKAFRKAINLDPKRSDFYYKFILFAKNSGDFSLAKMAYDLAEKNHARCDACHLNYFLAAIAERNFEEATRAYDELKASRSFQTTNIPNAVIGRYIELAEKSGNLDAARSEYQAAVENGSLDEVLQGIMITALINHGCYEEAQEIFTRVPAFKVSETGRELQELGYEFHGYSHGEGVCAIRSLLALNPEQTRIRVLTGQGNHSRNHPLFEFQRYIQNYVTSEMPGWSCCQPLPGNPGVYEIKLDA